MLLRFFLLIALFVVPASGGATPVLIVSVRSQMAPVTEFTNISVEVFAEGGARLFERTHAVRRSEDFNAGVRVFEQPVLVGRYQIQLRARDATNRLVAERSAMAIVEGGVQTVAVRLEKSTPAPPPPSPCQADHTRARRTCGQIAARCLADAAGRRDRIAACNENNLGCLAGADRALAQCSPR